MSSPYAILDNRPIDQWKVTELKEELKRRKLTVKGLKEDLVKRLDEAIHNETENAKGKTNNDSDNSTQPELQSEQDTPEQYVSETAKDLKDAENNSIEKVEGVIPEIEVDDNRGTLDEGKLAEEKLIHGSDPARVESEQVAALGTAVMVERLESVTALNVKPVNSNETKNENVDSTEQMDDDDSKSSQQDAKLNLSDSNSQVSEISESGVSVIPICGSNPQNCEISTETRNSEVKLEKDGVIHSSDVNYQVPEINSELRVSVSTEPVFVNEKNELKVDLVADNVKFVEVKPEMVLSLSSTVVPDDGEPFPMDVEESRDSKVPVEETGDSNTEHVDTQDESDPKKLGSRERLCLDQNSVDDSMGQDVLESKLMDSKSNSDEMRDKSEETEMTSVKKEDILESKSMDSKSNLDEMRERGEKTELPVVKEEDHVDVCGDDIISEPLVSNIGNKNEPAPTSVKRKSFDQGAAGNNDIVKRQRRWTSEAVVIPESQSGNILGSVTPKDAFKPAFKRSFSRSDSTISEETMKERVVPPSAKPQTAALRIDNFLRPFTLKAVQELLGKTGTISNFWMDHIKTHCYVSFSSVEEAVETRNAVYNLQWPPNGGRLLVAEFVDPQEVKARVEAPPLTPTTPSRGAPPAQPPVQLPQPSPRQQVQRLHLPPPPLPPPLPLANLPTRERPQLEKETLPREQPPPASEWLNLPPPPPLADKVDPPIVTLDDIFRKTKATPRIYYLPLSDEQVAEKLKAQGNNVKQ